MVPQPDETSLPKLSSLNESEFDRAVDEAVERQAEVSQRPRVWVVDDGFYPPESYSSLKALFCRGGFGDVIDFTILRSELFGQKDLSNRPPHLLVYNSSVSIHSLQEHQAFVAQLLEKPFQDSVTVLLLTNRRWLLLWRAWCGLKFWKLRIQGKTAKFYFSVRPFSHLFRSPMGDWGEYEAWLKYTDRCVKDQITQILDQQGLLSTAALNQLKYSFRYGEMMGVISVEQSPTSSTAMAAFERMEERALAAEAKAEKEAAERMEEEED